MDRLYARVGKVQVLRWGKPLCSDNVKEILWLLRNKNEMQCPKKNLLCLAEVFRRKQAILVISSYRLVIKKISNPEKFAKHNTKLPWYRWCFNFHSESLFLCVSTCNIMGSAAPLNLKQTVCLLIQTSVE